MSWVAAVRDARQTRRLFRSLAPYWKRQRVDEVRRRVGVSDLLIGLGFLGVPLLVPLFTWLLHQSGSRLWALAALVIVVLFSGHKFQRQALRFSATDVLRYPSKAGLVLLRLWHHLPAMAFLGACWAAGYAILIQDSLASDPWRSALLLLAVALTPLCWNVARLLARQIAGEVSALGPLLIPTLVAIYLLGTRGDAAWTWPAIVPCFLAAAVGVLATGRIVYDWVRRPRLHLRVLAVELGLLPRLLVACGLLVPAAHWHWLPAAGAPLLVLVLCLIGYSLLRLVTAVRYAEEETHGTWGRRVEPGDRQDEPVHVVLPSRHRGQRSLMRAAFYLLRRTHWFRPGELRGLRMVRRLGRILPLLVFHGWGVWLAVLSMLGNAPTTSHTLLALTAGLTAPTFVTTALSTNLHRLGIDYVQQVRHNLRALWLCAALPTLAAAAITGAVLGFEGGWRILLIIAATLAMRAGWRGLAGVPETQRRTSRDRLLPALALLAAGLVLVPSAWPPFVVLVGGLLGVGLRLRRLDERALIEDMQEDHAVA